MRMQTCRICHKSQYESNGAMVRVGTRHSVHWKCKLDSLPNKDAREKWILTLRLDQLETAPFMMLTDYSLWEFVRPLYTAKKQLQQQYREIRNMKEETK